MKKISCLMLLLSLAVFAEAQDFTKYKIAFKANPNISWMVPQNTHLTSEGSTVRFGFGVATDIHFTNNYAIGTGVNVDNYGGKLKYFETKTIEEDNATYITNTTRNYNLQYLEVPLTLKLRTNEIGYITYWGQFGLGLGVNIGAKVDEDLDFIFIEECEPDTDPEICAWKATEKTGTTQEKVNVKGDGEIGLFRSSLIIGAGIEYNLSGSTSLVAGVTFNNGFSNVFDKDAKGIEVNSEGQPLILQNLDNQPKTYKLKAINNYIALNLGILF